MPEIDTRSRLVEAAFRLFAEQGFDQTTVDQIAAEAGLGRTTFFRVFVSKESVLLPDHERLLGAVDARLASGSTATWVLALTEGATIVLNHYLDEGAVARERYRLTHTFPTLRDAETAGQRGYQRLFRDHALRWGHDPLTADLLGAGVVAAHNHVLRRWLREETSSPLPELAVAVTQVCRLSQGGGEAPDSQVIVLDMPLPADEVVAALTALRRPPA